MRKRTALVAGLVIMLAASVGWAEAEYRVQVNGRIITTDVPPQNIGGRIMVPIRAISEALGAEVNYDPETQTAIIQTSKSLRTELMALSHLRTDATSYIKHAADVIDHLTSEMESGYRHPDNEWGRRTGYMIQDLHSIETMENDLKSSPSVSAILQNQGSLTPSQIQSALIDALDILTSIRISVVNGSGVSPYSVSRIHTKTESLYKAANDYDYSATQRMEELLSGL